MEVSEDKIKELNEYLWELEVKRNSLIKNETDWSTRERDDLGYVMRGMTAAAGMLGISLEGKWVGTFYKRRDKGE